MVEEKGKDWLDDDARDGTDFVIEHKMIWEGWKKPPELRMAEKLAEERAAQLTGVIGVPMVAPVVEQSEAAAVEVINPQKVQKRKGMRLSTEQVAERLGTTRSAVHNLVRQGKLTDLAGPTAEGKVRHHYFFDAKEVRAFAKTYRNPRAKGQLKRLREQVEEARNGGGGYARAALQPQGVQAPAKRGRPRKQVAQATSQASGVGNKVYLIAEDSPVRGFMTQITAMREDMADLKATVWALKDLTESFQAGVQQLLAIWS